MKYTPEQVEEYLAHIKKNYGGKYTPEQFAEYEEFIKKNYTDSSQSNGFIEKAKETGLAIAEPVGKALDYLGGVSRSIVANAADPFVEGEVATTRDIIQALKANPPDSAEYLERAGVPELGALSDVVPGLYSETGDEWLKFQKDGPLDPSGRGGIGFALDTALDPTTYLSGGANAGLKALAKPSKALDDAGKSFYKNAFKRADNLLAESGKAPISDVLYKYGVSGSAQKIRQGAGKINQELMQKRDALINALEEAGIEIDMKNATKYARDHVEGALKGKAPKRKKIASRLKKELDEYDKLAPRADEVIPGKVQLDAAGMPYKDEDILIPGQRGVSPREAMDIKSSVTDELDEKAYNSVRPKFEDRFNKKLNKGLNEEIAGKADEFRFGSGGEFKDINKETSTLMTAFPELNKEARKVKPKFSALDSFGTGHGLVKAITEGDFSGLAGASLKKLRDIGIANQVRIGKGLKNASKVADNELIELLTKPAEIASKVPFSEVASRRSLIEILNELDKEEEKNGKAKNQR